ncbi:NB-ARC domain-containing protein [Thermosporothrix hazakensis]|jgi:tetratricopeptide (TPR) repeat protein|uniref:NB-ARC domain-containing protein n=1 Tax=Thermosporothrix hazakensis TaxID=644383 RepID=A0A326UBJ4_THEHA|nr:tetratricopeptide repeat protein [Thermosporothrix hazakensis]PZW35877.1 NB-ARC domain-containing protein [Thermosporothrix hazakensis]GCE46529.1 hypothetical protein KTH_13980 [Thermosporothrix hazakensis]
MGETLNLLFRARGANAIELEVRDSWSGRVVRGNFVPPFTPRQLSNVQKRLNKLECSDQELRDIGQRLYRALCGDGAAEAADRAVGEMLRSVIVRTLRRRGTVAMTLCFDQGCEAFARYPWELLHNGDHFLLGSGIFTLTRALLQPDMPSGMEFPVHPPMRVLYIGASPLDCEVLETELSFQALERGLAPLIETGQVFLDRLEPPTFDQLVRYLTSYGGVGIFNDNDTTIPCYIVHFDGHGTYGRLCPNEECGTINEADARKCEACQRSLNRVKPQTYLCFSDNDGYNRFIDTQTLRDLFVSSDVRLAVFSACETATMHSGSQQQEVQQQSAVDSSLAAALVTAQVPAVVAMPFSLQDDLSPTFTYHFYEALAEGKTLEEGLTRARQALLPMQQRSWFIPVLYRQVQEGNESPAPFLVSRDASRESAHPLAHLGAPSIFVGRTRELGDLDDLLSHASSETTNELSRARPLQVQHIALTGAAGIGKSALAFEVVRRNQRKFPGGIIGISLQSGKSFGDALLDIMLQLRIPAKSAPNADIVRRERLVLGALRSRASRELPCLLMLDGFEEIKERGEAEVWLRFLCSLPQEVAVLVTSRSNPETMMALGGPYCRWYEYRVGKMTEADLHQLFVELAAASGLDQRIHLDDPRQQQILREICTLLDGYPLGAELIFGTARTIGGRVYTPEATTRSLEEVRDDLRYNPLDGILAVLEVSYRRLTPRARLLLSYLSVFKLPFNREQIILLLTQETSGAQPVRLLREQVRAQEQIEAHEEVSFADLATHWRQARDELVQASFIQFDGHVYTIHPQIRHFAISHLPLDERRRIHRLVADYYMQLSRPEPEEWFAAFEHLEYAEDLQSAVDVAVRTAQALEGRGYARELLGMLQRAGTHASRLGDRACESRVQCALGAVLRLLGRYTEAEACLRSSLEFFRQQHAPEESGWALYQLALLFREEGNFALAGGYAEEALTLFQEARNPQGECWMRVILGEVKRGYGLYQEALELFERCLLDFRRLNDREGYAWALHDRALVYEALGEYTRALNDGEEARRIFDELQLLSGKAWALTDIALIHVRRAKFELAEQIAKEALTTFQDQEMQRGKGWALWLLGETARKRREFSQAHSCYDEARSIFALLGDRVNLARTLNSLGTLAFYEEDYLTAQDLYEQAQAIAQEQGARQVYGRALCGLGDVARILHRFTEAKRLYQEAQDVVTERWTVLLRLGLLAIAQQQYEAALECWVEALVLDRRVGHPERADLQHQIERIVAEHALQDIYTSLCRKYELSG